MIAQLFALLTQAWHILVPFFIVRVYEMAGVLRLGKYHRTCGPGFRWKWPFIEEPLVESVAVTMLRLQPQTCTTKDDVQVVVGAVVKYQLVDVEPYICAVNYQKDVLMDCTMGTVLRAVRSKTYKELIDNPPEVEIRRLAHKKVGGYGFKIISVTFTDLGKVRSLRLITSHEHELEIAEIAH